jgi:predicted MFS family arabinose efflux permease
MLVLAAAIGVLTLTGGVTPVTLLLLTFLLGIGAALMAPAWQAAIPDMVPAALTGSAILLNGVAYNAAIAIGPAIGGAVVGAFGPSVAFFTNGASFLATLLVLLRWKSVPRTSDSPSERIVSATRAGARYVWNAPQMHAILGRGAAFVLCASAIFALLPLLSRGPLHLGAAGYGLLLGCMGVGAVAGAGVLPRLQQALGIDRVVTFGCLAFSAAAAVLAFATRSFVAAPAMVLAGLGWICLMSSLMVATTTQVPTWVRGRAVATFLLVFQGGMAAGAGLWGAVAERGGIRLALLAAAAGLLLAATLGFFPRLHLHRGTQLDLSPSMHWPPPAVQGDLHPDEGPVVVLTEYRIDPANTAAFLEAARALKQLRHREGAFRWRINRDIADPTRYLESFTVESWGEHLRQHGRLNMADQQIELALRQFHVGPGKPESRHLLSIHVSRKG